MNKKLVAAALGLAFAAPVFADNSNVTLYGRIHQALEHNTSDVSPAAPATAGNGSNFANYSSRLGVRGVEDLGGGLSAIFAYEFGVDTEAGAGANSTRHAYVGFKNSLGTLVVGRQDGGNASQAPLYNQASAYILNIQNNAGQLTVVGDGATNDEVILRDQRRSNSIGVATEVAGVKISARHALAGTNQATGSNGLAGVGNVNRDLENTRRSTEIAADYTIGALTFGAGVQNIDRDQATTTQQNAAGGVGAGANAGGEVKSVVQFGASYKFTGFTLAGLVAQQRYFGLRDSDTQYSISGLLPLTGNSGLQAMYATTENGRQTAGVQSVAAGALETDSDQFQISAYYDFSKRTRSYVGFNRTTRETVPVAARVETDDDSFVVGIRHNF